MIGKKWILSSPFDGMPKLSDFKLVEETISEELKSGGNFYSLVN
jgi:hypothetical protein